MTAHAQEALRLNPGDLAATGKLVSGLLARGDRFGAEKAVRQLIQLDPNNADAHDKLASLLRGQTGQLDNALQHHREAILLQPRSAIYHFNLGLALKDANRHDEAIDIQRRALSLDGANPGLALDELVALHTQRQEWDQIEKLLQHVLKLAPQHPRPYKLLGGMQELRLRWVESANAYREALQRDPKDLSLYGNLWRVLLNALDDDQAIDQFRAAAEKAPKDPVQLCNLADILALSGRYSEALSTFERVLKLAPRMSSAYFGQSFSLLGGQDLDAALESLALFGNIVGDTSVFSQQAVELMSMVVLRPRLKRLRVGGAVPSNINEARTLAELAVYDRQYAAGAKAYALAFSRGPDPRTNKDYHGCYHAQCAVMAGTGADPTLTNSAQREIFRRQALSWLRGERQAWLADLSGTKRQEARWALRFWLQDPFLANVRDTNSLAKLPEEERKEWERFWADIKKDLVTLKPKP